MKLFSAETYIQRRQTLSNSLKDGLLLIMGNVETPMNYKDNTFRFKQDSNFLYYFGLNLPGLAAIIDLSSGETTLYGNDFGLDDEIWMGPQPKLQDLGTSVGVKRTAEYAQLEKDLKKSKNIHYLPPYRHERVIELSQYLGKSNAEIAQGSSLEFIKAVINQRSYKEKQEVDQMTKAVNISREIHMACMKRVASGKKEYEIVAKIYEIAKKHNSYLAYPAIATVNGQTLHNHYHGNTLEEGQLFLNDSGAESEMFYAGDITRTTPVSNRFSNKQKEIYNLVLKMEEDCIASLKPGDLYLDHHKNANKIMLEGLSSMDLLHGDVDEMVAVGVGGLFMPHGLGHMIGLDVHDMEDLGEQYVGYGEDQTRSTQLGLKSLRLAKKLEEGFVITVEPGIYFIPSLIEKFKAEGTFKNFVNYEKLKAFYNFGGIRIEDDVLITATGSQILGKRIPKTVEEIEGLRAN